MSFITQRLQNILNQLISFFKESRMSDKTLTFSQARIMQGDYEKRIAHLKDQTEAKDKEIEEIRKRNTEIANISNSQFGENRELKQENKLMSDVVEAAKVISDDADKSYEWQSSSMDTLDDAIEALNKGK